MRCVHHVEDKGTARITDNIFPFSQWSHHRQRFLQESNRGPRKGSADTDEPRDDSDLVRTLPELGEPQRGRDKDGPAAPETKLTVSRRVETHRTMLPVTHQPCAEAVSGQKVSACRRSSHHLAWVQRSPTI